MAPKSQQKLKTEDAERQKRILASKDKVLKIKHDILAVVEAMLEPDISKEWFLTKCIMLCHADYDDVVQERSIDHLCGYPMCSKPITEVMQQKYHISRVNNKIYDITERKNFCSNHCYKASNFLKEQLSPIPLYMRKEEHRKISFLSDCDSGSAGEEILFHHTIPKEEIDKVCTVDKPANAFMNMLNQEIKDCADSLKDLEIKEHVFQEEFVFENNVSEQKETFEAIESPENSEVASDDSEDEKLFPDYDNLSALSDKQMPIPRKVIKAQVISAIKVAPTSTPVQQLSFDFVSDVFKDWMTVDTMKYLLGEKYVYSLKADSLFEKMTTNDPICPERLAAIKNEYINLSLKIDSLPDDDDQCDSDDIDFICDVPKIRQSTKNNSNQHLKKNFKKRSKTNLKKYSTKIESTSDIINVSSKADNSNINNVIGKCDTSHNYSLVTDKTVSENDKLSKGKTEIDELSKDKTESDKLSKDKTTVISLTETNSSNVGQRTIKKRVSFQDSYTHDIEAPEESQSKNSFPEPGFPLVDSMSQNALRRQVLMSKFKSVYNDLLPLLGLHYTDIRGAVKKFVDTLSLTPRNIMFKPKEWKLLSIILLRILTKTVLKDIHNGDQFIKIFDNSIIPLKANIIDVENLVCDVMSPENIINLPILMH